MRIAVLELKRQVGKICVSQVTNSTTQPVIYTTLSNSYIYQHYIMNHDVNGSNI